MLPPLLTRMRKRSSNPIKPFSEVVTKFHCTFPKEAANTKDPTTRKSAIGVGVNSDNIYLPVGEEVTLEFDHWSILRDIEFPYLPRYSYDQIRTDKGWYPF